MMTLLELWPSGSGKTSPGPDPNTVCATSVFVVPTCSQCLPCSLSCPPFPLSFGSVLIRVTSGYGHYFIVDCLISYSRSTALHFRRLGGAAGDYSFTRNASNASFASEACFDSIPAPGWSGARNSNQSCCEREGGDPGIFQLRRTTVGMKLEVIRVPSVCSFAFFNSETLCKVLCRLGSFKSL